MSHTPGPWRWASTYDGRLFVGVRADDDTFSPIEGEVAREIHGRANATLIAASPDLLAALERFLAEAESWHHSTGHGEPGAGIQCDGICEAMGPARAAIAKATGSRS